MNWFECLTKVLIDELTSEEAAQVAYSMIQQQNASNADLDQRFARLETDSDNSN